MHFKELIRLILLINLIFVKMHYYIIYFNIRKYTIDTKGW
jgi:hypothetical protein